MRWFGRLLAFALLAAAFTMAAWAQLPPGALTLSEAVRLALERNPEVLVAREQLEELKGKITEVRAEAFPQVSLEGYGLRLRDPGILNSASFDNVPPDFRALLIPQSANLFDYGVAVSQPLYTAGKIRTAIKLALEGRREKEAALEAVRQSVAYRVFQAFHDLLLAQANLEVVRETYRQREQHLEQVRSRFANGVATEVDLLRSQVSLSNTDPELIRAENSIRQARSALNNLIVVTIEAPTEVDGKLEYRPWAGQSPADIQAQAMKVLPEILVAQRLVDEARLLEALAHAENKLKVDLQAGYGYVAREPKNLFNQDYNRWNVTVNFRLPLYDGGRKAGLIVQAGARLRTAEHNLAQLQNNVALEIQVAADVMQAAAKAIEAALLNVTQAEKVLQMMQANYQHGAATTLDVSDAQTALTIARNAVINATYLHQLAKARLRLAGGMPILEAEGNR
jgi:outer membrane protein